MESSNVSSQDGKTALVIDQMTGKIVDMATEKEIETLDLRGSPVLAAISNNRQFIAIVLRDIHADMYLFKKQGTRWVMSMLKRMNTVPESLVWEEPDDSRYPPIELEVQTTAGTLTFPLS